MALTPEELARWEGSTALALAATLHVGRTLRRGVDLAVPAVAAWARVRAGGETVEAGAADARPRRLLALGQDATLEVAGVRDEAALAALVRGLSVAVRNALAHEERRRLADTLRAAFLPPELPVLPGLDVAVRYRAAEEATSLGGDFYDLHRAEGGWALTLGDVCGKGVAAALMTAQLRQALRTSASVHADPGASLTLTDRVMSEADGSRFATVLHARLVPGEGGSWRVRLAGGGHPDPVLRLPDGTVTDVRVGGTVVGMLPVFVVGTVDVDLTPGATLVLVTDGIAEARAPGGRLLGEQAVRDVLADSRGLTAQVVAERVEQAALEHADGGPHDDLVVLVLQPVGQARRG